MLRGLERYALEHVDRAKALDRFLQSFDESERATILRYDLVYDAFLTWLIADDFQSGVLEGFRRAHRRTLSPGERQYFRALEVSEMRVYEVVDVHLDSGLTLRDRLSRDVVSVVERAATHSLLAGDVLAVRLLDGKAPGTLEMEHPVLRFLPTDGEELVEQLRRERRAIRRNCDELEELIAMRIVTPVVVNEFWVGLFQRADELRASMLDRVRTREGDPVAFHTVTFRLHDRKAVRAALQRSPDFDADKGGEQFVWLAAGDEPRSILGEVRLDDGVVCADVMSAERARRLAELLPALVGDAVSACRIEKQEPRHLHAVDSPAEADAIPPELEAEILGAFFAKHYATWIDEPLPALGGATPREAAARPKLRKRLIALLREFDINAEHERRAGEATYDFGTIWRELGLERHRLITP